MSNTSNPSTPERPVRTSFSPAIKSVRRVHTLPSKLADSTRTPSHITPSEDAIETLLNLDFARVVSFDDPTARPGSSRSDRGFNDHEHASLPWTVSTERTLAAGPFRIYRVPNTGISFLNSGAFLKPILHRTQCWCVNDGAKFILKSQSFYRIEVPSATEEDRIQIEQLRQALDKLCRYEKTPCPFRQGYVDEPEQPPTPLRRQSSTTERAKKWRLNGVWEPEDEDRRAEFVKKNQALSETLQHTRSVSLRSRTSNENDLGKPDPFVLPSRPNHRASSLGGIQPSQLTLKPAPSPEKIKANRLSGFRTGMFEQLSRGRVERTVQPAIPEDGCEISYPIQIDSTCIKDSNLSASQALSEPDEGGKDAVTANYGQLLDEATESTRQTMIPPQIIIIPQPPTTDDGMPQSKYDLETLSIHSSNDSFYSLDDELSIYHEPRLSPGADSFHSRSSSSGTEVPPTPRGDAEAPWSPMMEAPKASTFSEPISADYSGDEIMRVTSIAQALRRRRVSPILQLEEEHDDNPSQQPQSPQIVEKSSLSPRDFGSTVLRKTCDILLGPSFSLIALMIRIAQQILRRSPRRHHRNRSVPGAWESESEEIDDSDDTDWEDAIELDDYGYPVSGGTSDSDIPNLSHEDLLALSRAVETMVRNDSQDGWEVD